MIRPPVAAAPSTPSSHDSEPVVLTSSLSRAERYECVAVLAAALVVVITLLFIPSLASADSGARTSGPYFGVQGGAARYFPDNDACQEIIDEVNDAAAGEDDSRISGAVGALLNGSNCEADDSGTAFRIFGGYQFSRWFGVEASLVDLGSATANLATRTGIQGIAVDATGDINVDVKGFGLAAVVTAPIAPRFSVFGRVGVLAWDADATATARGTLGLNGQSLSLQDVTESTSRSGADVAWGAGVRVGITEQVNIRAEFTRYEVVDIDVGWIGIEVGL